MARLIISGKIAYILKLSSAIKKEHPSIKKHMKVILRGRKK